MRTLPLVPFVKERLLELKAEQEENRRLCGRSYVKDYTGYVCINEIGDIIKPNYVSCGFPKLLEEHGLRRVRYHDLRHSCASLLLANGVPMKQIQEWLGHSDFSTTANIYAHLEYSSKVISADVGYHIIQSFKPGEATPDQVHEIGCEFARRFLADRFECTVSTHLDKGHLHNHIVVNSVSFMDGRMFRNDFTTYYKGIRAVSDELCRENRLSVVETDGHGKSYGEWKHEKEGAPTLRGMVKADVEMAMASADSFAGFIAELQQMGYKVKYGPKVTHMAVRHKDAQRNIRLDKISPRFSEDALRSYFQELRKLPPAMQQEYKQQTVPHPPRRQPKEQPKPVRRRARYCGKLNYKCRKITGFMAFYYRYCALLRKAYKGKVGKRCYYLLRDDFLKYNRYRRQCDLLWKRQITTLDELLTYKENLQAEYSTLTAQRRALYRGKSKTTPADYSEQIQALTARIRELRREITTCADIEMDCEMVQDKVQRAAHRRENPPRERIHRRAY